MDTKKEPKRRNTTKVVVDKVKIVKRKCNNCGKVKKMGVYERFCSRQCRETAYNRDTSSYSVNLNEEYRFF